MQQLSLRLKYFLTASKKIVCILDEDTENNSVLVKSDFDSRAWWYGLNGDETFYDKYPYHLDWRFRDKSI